ncbi:hypothetical protein ACHAP8_008983 [Fusarium lateritium]
MLKSRDPVTITMLFTPAASPLYRYFAYSPQVRQMNLGHCPLPVSVSWTSDVHGLRLYTFAAQDQHLLYSMCGSHYNDNIRWRGLTAQETKELMVFDYDEYTNGNQKYELVKERLLTIESLLDHTDLAVTDTGNDNANGNTNDKEARSIATRIGLQIPNLHSKYQLFAVRAPIDKSANVGDEGLPMATCLGVDFIKPEDSETTRAFFDHLRQTTNATIVRLKVDFSVKPLKGESLAINALNYPPSLTTSELKPVLTSRS